MKIRKGFISNSSTTSFIVSLPSDSECLQFANSVNDFKLIMQDHFQIYWLDDDITYEESCKKEYPEIYEKIISEIESGNKIAHFSRDRDYFYEASNGRINEGSTMYYMLKAYMSGNVMDYTNDN
jgi:hypothetical protein